MYLHYCKNCGEQNLESFIDLGFQPNGNVFPEKDQLEKETKHPFNMLVCKSCWQVQLESHPPVEEMFSTHPYITGLNQPILQHFEELSAKLVDRFRLAENGLVVDVGANDGSLLNAFKSRGVSVLGIDPCESTGKLAQDKGIDVLRKFWGFTAAEELESTGVKPNLITATAVFYHVSDLHDFLRGIRTLLCGNGVFVAQCVYLKDLLEKAAFDHFYHEHTFIHSISPLIPLFKRHGLKIFDVEYSNVHGGSFLLYAALEESSHAVSKSVAEAATREIQAGMQNIQTYRDFAERVRQNRERTIHALKKIKKQGKRVFGLGAPVKGSTLLNYYGIDSSLIECIVEVNPEKIGRFTPGSHIPILDEATIDSDPDYYFVLSWNYLEFFKQKYQAFLQNGGRFLLPHSANEPIASQ